MRRFAFSIMAVLLATPGFAADIVLTVNNQSSQPVDAMSVYPVKADGTIIDDNIGGFYDPVAPGGVGTADLSTTRCGNVYVRLSLSNSEELTSIIDTCTQTTLVVTD